MSDPDDDTIRSVRRAHDDDTIRSVRRADDDTVRSPRRDDHDTLASGRRAHKDTATGAGLRSARRPGTDSAPAPGDSHRARVPDPTAVSSYPARRAPERSATDAAAPGRTPAAPLPRRARGRRSTVRATIAGILAATVLIVAAAVAALVMLISG